MNKPRKGLLGLLCSLENAGLMGDDPPARQYPGDLTVANCTPIALTVHTSPRLEGLSVALASSHVGK
jgi:hypothetical protein